MNVVNRPFLFHFTLAFCLMSFISKFPHLFFILGFAMAVQWCKKAKINRIFYSSFKAGQWRCHKVQPSAKVSRRNRTMESTLLILIMLAVNTQPHTRTSTPVVIYMARNFNLCGTVDSRHHLAVAWCMLMLQPQLYLHNKSLWRINFFSRKVKNEFFLRFQT